MCICSTIKGKQLWLSILLIGFQGWPSTLFTQAMELTLQTGHSDAILDVKFDPSNQFVASSDKNGVVILWDVLSGRQIKSFFGHKGSVNGIDFHPTKPWIVSAGADGQLVVWEYPSAKVIQKVTISDRSANEVAFSKDGQHLAVASHRIYLFAVKDSLALERVYDSSPQEAFQNVAISAHKTFIAAGGVKEKKVQVLDFKSGELVKTFLGSTEDLKFDKDDNTLFGAGIYRAGKWKISPKINLNNKSNYYVEDILSGIKAIALTDKYMIWGLVDGLIQVFHRNSGKKAFTLSGHLDMIKSLDLSSDGKTLVSAGYDRFILFWDLEKEELIRPLYGFIDPINTISFSKDGNTIFVGYLDGEIKQWNLLNNQMVFNKIEFKKKGNRGYFFNWTSIIDRVIVKEKTMEAFVIGKFLRQTKVEEYDRQAYPLVFKMSKKMHSKNKPFQVSWDLTQNEFRTLTDEETFLLQPSYPRSESPERIKESIEIVNGNQMVFNAYGQEAFRIENGHESTISAAKINPVHPFFASASWDGTIKFWDKKDGQLLLTLCPVGENDFVYITPENYYFASKNALAGVGLRLGEQVFPLAQFDVLYNRPDLALEKLPIVSDSLLQSYRRLYEKRLDKSDIKTDKVQVHLESLPELEVLNRDQLPINANQKKIILELAGRTKEIPLRQINIFVNGVPAFGRSGILLEKEEQYQFTKDIPVLLSNGNNRIQLSVTNQSGLQSVEETLQLAYISSDKEKDDLYVISIGVSKYLEGRKNLDYAAKDATDISSVFERVKNRYQAIHSYLLTDQDFTHSSFDQVKQFLAQSRIDDEVIIFYAGHGLLDDSLDFYLATYDVDFLNPNNGGLAYQELEQLLEDIPARKKLLILDACHSGEIDKEGIQFTKTYEKGKVKLRNVHTFGGESSIGLQNSFDLMRTLFANMNRATGAHIISSAKGGEFAFESADWNNGAFTYCLLDGLQNQKADLNGDKEIMFSELQQYLSEEVPKITDHRQQPTVRNENLWSDYRIW